MGAKKRLLSWLFRLNIFAEYCLIIYLTATYHTLYYLCHFQANSIGEAGRSLTYTIHQNTSSVNSTVHALKLADDPAFSTDPAYSNDPAYSSLKAFFVCDCCMFTLDLTPLFAGTSDDLQVCTSGIWKPGLVRQINPLKWLAYDFNFEYSYHLNTKHLKSNHLIFFRHVFVPYPSGLITWLGKPFEYQAFSTIKQTLFVQFSDHHSKTGPFENWTCSDHLNTRHV